MGSESAADVQLSVIVVLLEGHETLRRCLRALADQLQSTAAEIIVPWDAEAGDKSRLGQEFRSVRFLTVGGSCTYAELRSHGVRAARGRVVAVTEDHCTPAPDWCGALLRAHAQGHAVVGGAVEKQTPDRAVGWAVYLADYVRYMQPMPEGPTQELTDCNVSYQLSVLRDVEPLWAREFHEPVVHAALRSRGHDLWFAPDAVVRQGRRLTLAEALRDRYSFGRLFGATRVAGTSAVQRASFAAGSVLLPALLTVRVVGQVLRKRRHLGASVRALPAVVLLNSAWGLGELLGYLTGQPGAVLTPGQRRSPPREAVERQNIP